MILQKIVAIDPLTGALIPRKARITLGFELALLERHVERQRRSGGGQGVGYVERPHQGNPHVGVPEWPREAEAAPARLEEDRLGTHRRVG